MSVLSPLRLLNGRVGRRLVGLLVVPLALAGCASATVPLPPTTPATSCDFRMIDHNRRACVEHGRAFTEPVPGSLSCGVCTR